jgi:hypothetical protein
VGASIIRVQVPTESMAVSVAHDLIGIVGLDLRPNGDGWEVVVDAVMTDRLVVRLVNAAQEAIRADADASAILVIDSREYTIRNDVGRGWQVDLLDRAERSGAALPGVNV